MEVPSPRGQFRSLVMTDQPKTTLLFRRAQTAHPLRVRVHVFVGAEGSRQNTGSFLITIEEWAILEPALRAAGEVEVQS